MLDIFEKLAIISHVPDAGVAHPVERHLAKVEVASSSLVTRSIKDHTFVWSFFFVCIRFKPFGPQGRNNVAVLRL